MTEWRSDPRLQGRFHPDYPDDLQIILHEGGPRVAKSPPELVWVRIESRNGPVHTGRLLNQPTNLKSHRQGDAVLFLVPEGGPYPIQVREKYLAERPEWKIGPCNGCGMTELMDAPSDLCRVVFPDMPAGAVMQGFTARCGCGGAHVVEHVEKGASLASPPARKAWWQFWK